MWNETMEFVCAQIRDIRIAQEVPVCELAAAIGVPVSTIHRWESPNWRERKRPSWPSMKRLVQIAIALGVRLSDLMPDEEP